MVLSYFNILMPQFLCMQYSRGMKRQDQPLQFVLKVKTLYVWLNHSKGPIDSHHPRLNTQLSLFSLLQGKMYISRKTQENPGNEDLLIIYLSVISTVLGGWRCAIKRGVMLAVPSHCWTHCFSSVWRTSLSTLRPKMPSVSPCHSPPRFHVTWADNSIYFLWATGSLKPKEMNHGSLILSSTSHSLQDVRVSILCQTLELVQFSENRLNLQHLNSFSGCVPQEDGKANCPGLGFV